MIHASHIEELWSIYPIGVYMAYFTIFEAFQIMTRYKSAYSSDLWNLVDLVFICLLGGYIFTSLQSEEKRDNLTLLAIVNLLSWIRGIS